MAIKIITKQFTTGTHYLYSLIIYSSVTQDNIRSQIVSIMYWDLSCSMNYVTGSMLPSERQRIAGGIMQGLKDLFYSQFLRLMQIATIAILAIVVTFFVHALHTYTLQRRYWEIHSTSALSIYSQTLGVSTYFTLFFCVANSKKN